MGVSICNIKSCNGDDFPESIKEYFINYGVYSEKKFMFLPVELANKDLKKNKLIFDIVDHFYSSKMNLKIIEENEIDLIREKFLEFRLINFYKI